MSKASEPSPKRVSSLAATADDGLVDDHGNDGMFAQRPFEVDDDDVTSPHAAERELARQMSQLSMPEREASLYDIHGVSEMVQETPDFVFQKLQELDAALSAIEAPSKQAYTQALQLDPTYAMSEGLRLKFLRADTFDPVEAAKRMVRHFETKLKLFGPEKLTKELGVEDLSPEDQEVIESGWLTLLPLRDTAGRLIMVNTMPLRCGSATSRTRFLFVLLCLISKEESDQRKGLVALGFHNQAKNRPVLPVDPALAQVSGVVVASSPIKFCSIHACEDKGGPSAVKAFITKLDAQTRNRYKWHQIEKGDYNNLHFQLMPFGIPTQVLPLSRDGVYDLTYHREFVKEQRLFEQEAEQHTSQETLLISEPGPNDVKLGREYRLKTHGGNLKYLDMVYSHLEEYDSLHRFERRKILVKIYNAVKASGGRFVKRTESGDGWLEIPFEVAIDKISNAFRTRRKTNKTNSLHRSGGKASPDKVGSSSMSGDGSSQSRSNKRSSRS